jgi:hypothetical protein
VPVGILIGTAAGRDVAEYNLERKHVFNVFGWVAEAARG